MGLLSSMRRCWSSIYFSKRRTTEVCPPDPLEVSNNEDEYEALLHGLRLAISVGIKRLLVYGDSLLVVQQVNKEWDCNKEIMDTCVQEVRKLENKFSGLEVHHVVRDHNVGADILSKLGSTRAQVPAGVFVQELKQPSIKSSP
jgi:ribonuclease HI